MCLVRLPLPVPTVNHTSKYLHNVYWRIHIVFTQLSYIFPSHPSCLVQDPTSDVLSPVASVSVLSRWNLKRCSCPPRRSVLTQLALRSRCTHPMLPEVFTAAAVVGTKPSTIVGEPGRVTADNNASRISFLGHDLHATPSDALVMYLLLDKTFTQHPLGTPTSCVMSYAVSQVLFLAQPALIPLSSVMDMPPGTALAAVGARTARSTSRGTSTSTSPPSSACLLWGRISPATPTRSILWTVAARM